MLIITYISNVTLACDDGDPTKAHKAMTDFLILNLTDFTDDTLPLHMSLPLLHQTFQFLFILQQGESRNKRGSRQLQRRLKGLFFQH